jgi:two-component system, cell cycle response regulator
MKIMRGRSNYMGQQLKTFNTTDTVVYKIKTLEEAQHLSVHISNQTPKPIENLIISELMYNAIEHGNLEISFEEKVMLLENFAFMDEVNRRLSLPQYKNRYAQVTVKMHTEIISVSITDMGNGFNYEKFLQIDESRIFSQSGRGIALANSVLNLSYNSKGNEVMVKLPRA